MVEFTLPANSKVKKGITHPVKEVSEKPKKVIIYRWNPEAVSYTHLTLPTN